MAATQYFLAFDCGATSGRGVLATFEGGPIRDERLRPGGCPQQERPHLHSRP